jgi:hypothetical protein
VAEETATGSTTIADRTTSALAALRAHQVAVYALIILAYVVYCLHQPIGLYANAGYDDWWYMERALDVLDGDWMGTYSQFALVKGPGYIFFLVVNHWLGIPISLSMALFYAAGCAALTASLGRAARLGVVWQFVVFNLVLWHPAMVPNRVYRDEIYPGLVLLVLAAAIALTFAETTRRTILLSVALGLSFGYFWMTREEGVWLVPGLALLGIVSVVRARRLRRGGLVTLAWLLAAVVAAVPSLALATVNQHVYGTFTVVDWTGRPFQGGLKALDSIEAGPEYKYVSVSHEAMEAAYKVSPAARELAPYFNDPSRPWQWTDCADKTYRCGEVISGWFPWALRNAVYTAGHYSSAADADSFYRRLTQEIEDACDSGKLKCRGTPPIPLMPAMSRADLARVPGSIVHVTARTVRLDTLGSAHPGPSAGGVPNNLPAAIALTGRPLIVPTVESDPKYDQLDSEGLRLRIHLESIYRPVTWIVAGAGVLSLLAGLVLLALGRPVARRLMVVSGAVWLLYLARVGVLALVDATTFPVDHAMYIGSAYTMLLLASLLSTASVMPALRAGPGRRGPRARPHRGRRSHRALPRDEDSQPAKEPVLTAHRRPEVGKSASRSDTRA